MYRQSLIFILILVTNALFGQDTINPDGYNIFNYENGEISSEGNMRNGKPDGYWETYYENGVLKSEGNRQDFLLDGPWKFYDENGSMVLSINYKNGQKNGLRITYLDKEIIAENFENDIKQGLTTYYYPDSTIFKTVNFVNGREDGLAKEFGNDGRVITITVYKKGYVVSREKINRIDKEGRKQRLWKFFHDNGLVRIEGRFKNDLKHGYFKEYDKHGKLLSTAKYIDGEAQENVVELSKLEVRTDYYPDGSVKIVQSYKDDIPEGVRREYAPDGTIETSYIFKKGKIVGEGIVKEDGKKDGSWEEFYSDGRLKAQGIYNNETKVGEWKYFYKNGNLEQTGQYDDEGKLIGDWKWYYPSGNILREESFIDGLADGLMTEYSEEGRIITEGEFIEGMEEGPWFFEYGDYREEGEYSYGMRNGVWKYFFGNGALKFEGEFIENNPNGKHIYYWDNGNKKDEIEYLMGMKEGDWKKYNYDGTLFLIITYRNGIEKKYDGIKIKPEFEEILD